jgi:hypothetical protein
MAIEELNVEGYRIIGDILLALREATRRGLVSSFGERWFETALPQELFDRLIARKEREKSVNAYNGDYFAVIEYADFADLAEIHDHKPEIASFLQPVSPNPQVRRTRMIELHSLHEKLAGMREINEAELAFLRNFFNRLSGIIVAFLDARPDRTVWSKGHPTAHAQTRSSPPAAPVPQPVAPQPQPVAPPPPPRPAASRPDEQLAALSAATATRPVPATVPVFRPLQADPEPPAAQPPIGEREAPHQGSTALRAAATHRSESRADEGPAVSTHSASSSSNVDIDALLERGDDRGIVEALYHEILDLSESLMSSAGSRRPKIWEKVSESDWYGRRFSALGMRPLSDYYGLYQTASERLRAGATKAQLQDFLQAHSYPQVVLAMGAFFQQQRGNR